MVHCQSSRVRESSTINPLKWLSPGGLHGNRVAIDLRRVSCWSPPAGRTPCYLVHDYAEGTIVFCHVRICLTSLTAQVYCSTRDCETATNTLRRLDVFILGRYRSYANSFTGIIQCRKILFSEAWITKQNTFALSFGVFLWFLFLSSKTHMHIPFRHYRFIDLNVVDSTW